MERQRRRGPEIDFDARELVLHPSLPQLGPHYQRLPLVEADGSLFVRGEVTVGDRTEATDFLLHTGFGGTALLDEFDGALGGRRTSELGGELLQRCNLVLDRAGKQVFVAKSQRANAPFSK